MLQSLSTDYPESLKGNLWNPSIENQECLDCGTKPVAILGQIPAGRSPPFVTRSALSVSLHKETQDYAARFGLSSEGFGQVFETAFLDVT